MAASKGRRAKHTADTRAAILRAARDLFTRAGYHETSLEDIAEAADVSKSALYHHVESKKQLFEVVVEEVLAELVARVEESQAGKALAARWAEGATQYLDAAVGDRTFRQIVLLDGPTVLGWQRWRDIQARHQGEALNQLQKAMDAGVVEAQPVGQLLDLVIAVANHAVMVVAYSDDPEQSRREVGRWLDQLIAGFDLHQTPNGGATL
jgi:AcrR family transcriptional regulator